MDRPDHSTREPIDPAAGGRAWRPSFGHLAIAVVGIVGGAAAWWMTSPAPPPAAEVAVAPVTTSAPHPFSAPTLPVTAVTAVAAASASAGSMRPPTAMPAREPDGDLTPDLTVYLNRGETPAMAEVIDRLHRAGVHTGVGAFAPPGTSPPLVGLAVPEDFVLPEGYVRHHQTTDDGQRIEPILMYAPDALPRLDAAGRPVAVPKDRVVPPELAPPGLPIRRIVIPGPVEPERSGG